MHLDCYSDTKLHLFAFFLKENRHWEQSTVSSKTGIKGMVALARGNHMEYLKKPNSLTPSKPSGLYSSPTSTSHFPTGQNPRTSRQIFCPESTHINAKKRSKEHFRLSCFLGCWGNHLHTKSGNPQLLLSKQRSLQAKLLTWAQTTPARGHPGTNRIYHFLQAKYWWLNKMTGVHRFISSCTQAKVHPDHY